MEGGFVELKEEKEEVFLAVLNVMRLHWFECGAAEIRREVCLSSVCRNPVEEDRKRGSKTERKRKRNARVWAPEEHGGRALGEGWPMVGR